MAIQDQTLKNTYSGGVNAYGEKLGGFGATSAPIIPQNIPSINSSTLTPQPDLSSSLPQPSQPQAQWLNASVPSPQSLIQNAYAPTNTDSKQNDLLTRLATTIGGQQGLTTLTNQYEQQLGVQDLAKKANEASAQLEALNNQSLALQNQYNYTIPNQMQESAFGRGITAGGLAPLQAGELRKNQIQQGIIASQALTAKSLYYAANNNLVLAKDSAEKAAKAQYEQQQIGIDALKAQLEAVKPQLDREEKARALILESELNDRQKQLDYARKDKETILSWAAAATANGATPLQAQEITKANDLNSAFALYAPFAVDPMATQKAILDLEDQRAGITLKKAQAGQVYANIAKINKEITDLDIGTINNPDAGQYSKALSVILGSGKFTKDQKADVVRSINSGEDPLTVIKNQAKNLLGQSGDTKLTAYEVAKSQLDDVDSLLKDYYASGGETSIFKGSYEKVVNKLGEVKNPKLVEISTQIAAALQIYRNAVSGTAYSVQEGRDIASIFPGINKTEGLNTAILNGRKKAFDSTIDASYRSVLGSTYDELKKSQSQSSDNITQPDGTTWKKNTDGTYTRIK